VSEQAQALILVFISRARLLLEECDASISLFV
jgi:hypothetical protein